MSNDLDDLLRNNWRELSDEELGRLIKSHILSFSDNDSEACCSALRAYDALQDDESRFLYNCLYLINIINVGNSKEELLRRLIVMVLRNRLHEKGKDLSGHDIYNEEFFFGKQYFCLSDKAWAADGDNEIFIDCGAFEGEVIKGFVEYCGGRYNKIYSFEPIPNQFENTLKNITEAGIKKVELIQKGVWSSKAVFNFSDNSTSSRISYDGKIPVEVVPIDEVIPENEKVTFIKMDVEGAEFEALKGAVNTIRRCKPKLAVCLYHRTHDIIEIPTLLNMILPEYKFYIRHHSMFLWETVLYALPPKL